MESLWAQVKKGPLAETSPMLNDISGVPSWVKARSTLHCTSSAPTPLLCLPGSMQAAAMLSAHALHGAGRSAALAASSTAAAPVPALCCQPGSPCIFLLYGLLAALHAMFSRLCRAPSLAGLVCASAGELGHAEDVPGGGAVQGAHHAALPLRQPAALLLMLRWGNTAQASQAAAVLPGVCNFWSGCLITS